MLHLDIRNLKYNQNKSVFLNPKLSDEPLFSVYRFFIYFNIEVC